MHSVILAAIVFLSATALADPPVTGDALETAVERAHDASVRVGYHAQQATIAERDIVTAQIVRDMARRQRDLAVRDHRSADAGAWAQRHAEAMSEEAAAERRAGFYRRERDKARADFEASAERLRRLTRQARAGR